MPSLNKRRRSSKNKKRRRGGRVEVAEPVMSVELHPSKSIPKLGASEATTAAAEAVKKAKTQQNKLINNTISLLATSGFNDDTKNLVNVFSKIEGHIMDRVMTLANNKEGDEDVTKAEKFWEKHFLDEYNEKKETMNKEDRAYVEWVKNYLDGNTTQGHVLPELSEKERHAITLELMHNNSNWDDYVTIVTGKAETNMFEGKTSIGGRKKRKTKRKQRKTNKHHKSKQNRSTRRIRRNKIRGGGPSGGGSGLREFIICIFCIIFTLFITYSFFEYMTPQQSIISDLQAVYVAAASTVQSGLNYFSSDAAATADAARQNWMDMVIRVSTQFIREVSGDAAALNQALLRGLGHGTVLTEMYPLRNTRTWAWVAFFGQIDAINATFRIAEYLNRKYLEYIQQCEGGSCESETPILPRYIQISQATLRIIQLGVAGILAYHAESTGFLLKVLTVCFGSNLTGVARATIMMFSRQLTSLEITNPGPIVRIALNIAGWLLARGERR